MQKEQQVHFFQGLYAFHFGLPTNVKLAICAAISEGTPWVLVGMNLLLLATLATLSGNTACLTAVCIWHTTAATSQQQQMEH